MSLSNIDASNIQGHGVNHELTFTMTTADLTLKNSRFDNTVGLELNTDYGHVQITDTEIYNSSSHALQINILSGDENITIDNVTIDGSGNQAIYLLARYGWIKISNSIIRNCKTTTSHNGAGIHINRYYGNATISDCLIENVESIMGGGIGVGSSYGGVNSDYSIPPAQSTGSNSLTITNTTIRNAKTTGSQGGGLYFSSSGSLIITGSTFESCRTGGSRVGTIYSPFTTPILTNTQFINCSQ
jgi:hypothetical protein